MRTIRKSLSFLLVLALCLTVLSVPAFASSGIIVDKGGSSSGAQYRSTRAFIDALEAEDYSYDYEGIDDDGDELVIVGFNIEGGSVDLRFYFDENEENANVRAWNIIDYELVDWTNVVQVLDGLNGDYNYVRFYTDDYDNSVTAAIDLIFRENDVGAICLEAIYYMVTSVEEALPLLTPYGK